LSACAAPLLEDLHRRHLFIDRRNAQEPVYQFHALFRTFLQHRANQRYGARADSETALLAARLLEEGGHPKEAFPLALKGGNIPAAVAITLGHAAKLIGQGRWRIVVEWIETLPGDLVASNCWLLQLARNGIDCRRPV
jgi:ATP/maltotriose-dependent transcriptional regulator MalT